MTDNLSAAIDPIPEILALDTAVQRYMRAAWPESWLSLHLPLGSTRALFVIDQGLARTPGSVAEMLNVSKTSVTGMLDRLESAGLLVRQIDPDDRRCFVLSLTAEGHALIAELESRRQSELQQALTTMDPAALAALTHGLQALVASLRDRRATRGE